MQIHLPPKTIHGVSVNSGGKGGPFMSVVMRDGTWLAFYPHEINAIREGLDKLEAAAASVLCDESHADDDTKIISEREAREVLGQQTVIAAEAVTS